MEEKQNQILPNSIEEYEKEIKPRFGEAYVTAKRPVKFDVCSLAKPKNRCIIGSRNRTGGTADEPHR